MDLFCINNYQYVVIADQSFSSQDHIKNKYVGRGKRPYFSLSFIFSYILYGC